MEKNEIELAIIIPVYNEMEIIEKVIVSWTKMLEGLGIDFELRAYNDGSKDKSLKVLKKIAKAVPQLVVLDKSNSGHGPTILMGYREASAKYIFQIDSDNEIESQHFEKFWKLRDQYDFIIGERNYIQTPPLSRILVSKVARFIIFMFYGSGAKDVNCPYRLLKTSSFEELLYKILDDTFAPNLILSGYANKSKMRLLNIQVDSEFRKTGTVSIQHWKLLRVAFKSLLETILFRFK